MTVTHPIAFRWTGNAMVPLSVTLAGREYKPGEVYRLVPHEGRSHRSHAHYFAALNEAWRNLPEPLAVQFPSVEHLRKYALIRCGYRDERSIVTGSELEARRFAEFMRPVDAFSVVWIDGRSVHVFTARSQSASAMGKDEFQRSKDAVLQTVSGMINVTVDELNRNAGQAA